MKENDKIGGFVHIILVIIFLIFLYRGALMLNNSTSTSVNTEGNGNAVAQGENAQVIVGKQNGDGTFNFAGSKIQSLTIVVGASSTPDTSLAPNKINSIFPEYVPNSSKDDSVRTQEPIILSEVNINERNKKQADGYHTITSIIVGVAIGTSAPKIDKITPPSDISCKYIGGQSPRFDLNGPMKNRIVYIFAYDCVSPSPVETIKLNIQTTWDYNIIQ